MRLILDSKAQFKVTINPYLGKIEIYHPKSKKYVHWNFNELDEWMIKVFEGIEYHFHFMYDEEEGTQFSVYLRNGEYQPIPFNLDIKI